MFIPLRDSPNDGGTPFVNYALIAINVAIFLAVTLPMSGAPVDPSDPVLGEYLRFLSDLNQRSVAAKEVLAEVSAYDLFVFEHGYRPARPSVVSMFTSMFLHGGVMHLLGNMLFLWIYGDNVEHRLGHLRYAFAYLATGVAATLFHAVFDLSSNVPMVGASGAISGVLGFYFLLFPRNTVKVFVAMFVVGVFSIPARIVLGVYLVVDNLLPVLLNPAGGVAHGAHIGGFLAGLGAAWLVDRKEVAATPPEYKRARFPKGAADGAPSPPAVIAQLIRRGQMAEAAQAYFSSTEGVGAEPAPQDALALGRWLAEEDHPTAALTVFRRILKHQHTGPLAAWAHVGAGLVQLEDLDRATAAYQHFLDAIDLDPSGEAAAQARIGIADIDARTA